MPLPRDSRAQPDRRKLITISDLPEAIAACLAQGQAMCIHGGTGVGKTSVVRQTLLALEHTSQLFVVGYRQSTDLAGIPNYRMNEDGEQETFWTVPSFVVTARRLAKAALAQGRPHVIVWDELNRVENINVLNAAAQAIHENNFGDHYVDNLWHIAAVNDAGDSSGVTAMPDHLRARFVHYYVVPDVPGWLDWARKQGLHPAVIDYVRKHPDHLVMHDKKVDASPNPRTWEFCSNTLAQRRSTAVENASIYGAIGPTVGEQFVPHLALIRSLAGKYDIPRILASPTTEPVPTEVSEQYAVSNAVSMYTTLNTADNAVTYLRRMSGEMQTFAILAALRRTGEGDQAKSPLHACPKVAQWIIEFNQARAA